MSQRLPVELTFVDVDVLSKVQDQTIMTERTLRKQRTGIVTSTKMDKSIVVSVEKKVKHPIYGKFVKRSKKFVAHDAENSCNEGDTVRIMETRPLSKRKCWRLVEILERAK